MRSSQHYGCRYDAVAIESSSCTDVFVASLTVGYPFFFVLSSFQCRPRGRHRKGFKAAHVCGHLDGSEVLVREERSSTS